MTTKTRLLLLLLALIPTACSVGLGAAPMASLPGPGVLQGLILATTAPNPTATPTPFQPIPPTPVYLPTDIPTPTPSPTPQPTPTARPPEPLEPVPGGIVTFLLLGSDQREQIGGMRTDTIILAIVNPATETIGMLSFPRDLYVPIPGCGMNRINTAFQCGGFKTLNETLKYNFGVSADHYVLIDFHSFAQLIDSLGGIDVRVAQTYTDKRQGFGNFTIEAGTYHMNGRVALWYVRARKASNDFSRGRRQQEVIMAIAEKMLSLDALSRAPDLYQIYRKSVTTDMKLGDMLGYIPLATHFTDLSKVRRYYIGPQYVYDWITPEGGMVLLPRADMIQVLVRKAMKGKPE